MAESTKSMSDEQAPDQALAPLTLVNRLITLLFWVVIPYVLLLLGLAVFAVLSPSIPGAPSLGPEFVAQAMQSISTMATSLWGILFPIISFIIIIMLLRWLLFGSPTSNITTQFRQTFNDVPSLVAIVVIATICILPFLRITVPDPLGNIALVIVGFYFGSESKTRTRVKDNGAVGQTTEPPVQSAEQPEPTDRQ